MKDKVTYEIEVHDGKGWKVVATFSSESQGLRRLRHEMAAGDGKRECRMIGSDGSLTQIIRGKAKRDARATDGG